MKGEECGAQGCRRRRQIRCHGSVSELSLNTLVPSAWTGPDPCAVGDSVW
jgi:hypothetical protein